METKKLNLEYENLCFRYKKFIAGDNTIKFSTSDFAILFDKITELEQININNENVIYKLDNKDNDTVKELENKINSEITNNSFLKMDLKKQKEELEQLTDQYKKCYHFKEKYKKELEQIKTKAFIPTKKIQQITEQQIQEIKTLRNQDLSYSEIERITKWSKYTISKVLNGHYDTK